MQGLQDGSFGGTESWSEEPACRDSQPNRGVSDQRYEGLAVTD